VLLAIVFVLYMVVNRKALAQAGLSPIKFAGGLIMNPVGTVQNTMTGVGNFFGKAPLPPFPTQALPGSPEKILLLSQRAQQRQELFHPQDVGGFFEMALNRVG